MHHDVSGHPRHRRNRRFDTVEQLGVAPWLGVDALRRVIGQPQPINGHRPSVAARTAGVFADQPPRSAYLPRPAAHVPYLRRSWQAERVSGTSVRVPLAFKVAYGMALVVQFVGV